jgi:hypothetical protein
VYPALLAFQLWAIVSWLEGRVMRAALLGGLAILCSPTALTALPLLGLRRFHRLEVVRFGGVALLTCLPVIAYFRQDYLWGARGILSTFMAFEPLDMLAYRLRQLPEVFQGGLLVLGAGLAFVPPASQERLKVLLREVVATVLLTLLVVDHFRDVPAQLLPMVLLTPVLSTGLAGLLERISLPSTDLRRWNPPILVVCGLLLCLVISADQQARAARRQELKFAEHCRRVAGLLEPDARVVGDFRERTLFEWYVDGWTGTGRTLSPEAAAQSRGAALYRLSLPAEPTALDRRLELKAPGLWLIQPEAGQPKP